MFNALCANGLKTLIETSAVTIQWICKHICRIYLLTFLLPWLLLLTAITYISRGPNQKRMHNFFLLSGKKNLDLLILQYVCG